VFIAINFNGSNNKIEENWGKPTFFIQDGGYLFTNSMSGAARLPALLYILMNPLLKSVLTAIILGIRIQNKTRNTEQSYLFHLSVSLSTNN